MANIVQLQQQADTDAQSARNLYNRSFQQAQAEGRPLTAAEKQIIDEAIERMKASKAKAARAQGDANMMTAFDRMTGGLATASSNGRGSGQSLGAQILNSDLGKWLIANRHQLPTGQWTSPISSDLPGLEFHATTLTEGVGSGGALVHPDIQPIIVPTPTRPLTIADLCAPGTTNSNVVQYTKETAFTNAAAAVLEGGLKPESALAFAAATSPVIKVAHWVPVTEEILEDAATMQGYLDARLSLGVRIAEEDELLNGGGTAPHMTGFLNLAGLSPAIARGTDSNADAVLKQIAAIHTATNMAPTAVVLNPTNWLTTQLTKTGTGEYLSGAGPLTAPAAPTLWGLPCAVTPAIAVGTALVGCFATMSQIFRRGGLRVEASNAHASFFINNLVAIRAEERLALCAYREACWGLVTGLN